MRPLGAAVSEHDDRVAERNQGDDQHVPGRRVGAGECQQGEADEAVAAVAQALDRQVCGVTSATGIAAARAAGLTVIAVSAVVHPDAVLTVSADQWWIHAQRLGASQRLLRDGLGQVLEHQPDLIVLLGDLTNNGRPEELDGVLDALDGCPVPTPLSSAATTTSRAAATS